MTTPYTIKRELEKTTICFHSLAIVDRLAAHLDELLALVDDSPKIVVDFREIINITADWLRCIVRVRIRAATADKGFAVLGVNKVEELAAFIGIDFDEPVKSRVPQIWQEAEDLIIMKLPDMDDVRISKRACEIMFADLAEILKHDYVVSKREEPKEEKQIYWVKDNGKYNTCPYCGKTPLAGCHIGQYCSSCSYVDGIIWLTAAEALKNKDKLEWREKK